MSVDDRARALMHSHHHLIRHRQQSLLSRTATEVGMPQEMAQTWTHIQGKPSHDNAMSYDRRHASAS